LNLTIIGSLLLPLAGTSLGAGCVFLMKRDPHPALQRGLTGFAAGVMVAASVWSLLIPAIEQSGYMGTLSFLFPLAGFLSGIFFLLFLDHRIPHLHINSDRAEGPETKLQKTTMLVFAVTLHNVPEGMAVGAVCAGWFSGTAGITLSGVCILALGIAIQNIPEGAIISMPLMSEGTSKKKSFLYGVLSGIVEPAGAMLTIFAAGFLTAFLPFMLSFAAGAMIFVVVEELIPEMSQGVHSDVGTIFFSIGFALMMVLDVALG